MSFSRAQVKRFNDNQGTGPAPGAYNVKDIKQSSGVLPFKVGGERFKNVGDGTRDDAQEEPPTFLAPQMPAPPSKKKLNFSAANNNESKPGKSTPRQSPNINKGKEAYEKEIRRLIQQVNDQDKKLSSKVEEIRKLESRVNLLVKEKSSLLGQVAVAERKVTELDKRNALLESQTVMQKEKQLIRDELEIELKKTRTKLETAKQELDKSKSMLVAMQSDLDGARSTITVLQKSNSALTRHNNEAQKHNDDVGIQMSKLQGLVDDLRSDKAAAEQQVADIKERFNAVQRDFTSLLQDKAEEIKKQYESKQQVLLTDLERTKNDAVISHSKALEIQNKLDAMNKESDGILTEKTELQHELEIAQEKNILLQESLGQHKLQLEEYKCNTLKIEKDRNELDEKVSQLSESIGRLKIDSSEATDALKKELLSVQKSCTEKESELSDTVYKLQVNESSLKSEITTLIEDLEVKKREYDELRLVRDTVSEELKSCKSKFEEEKNIRIETCQKYEEQSKKLEELNQMKNDLLSQSSQHTAEANELKEQILVSEAKADALETQLMQSSAKACRALREEEEANGRIEQLEIELTNHKAQYQAKLNEFTRRLLETQKKLNAKQEELTCVTAMKDSESVELKKMKKLVDEQSVKLLAAERLANENATSKEKIVALQNEITNSKASSEGVSIEELEKWRDLYNELQEKVKPFQSQIDAYSAERQSLLSENSMAQAEMQDLGRKYAQLLGHQNHKQKIKHIVRIKEENNKLKQEVAKLRTQVEKMRKETLAKRPKKFDPSDAFKHKKENTPLCDNV